MKKSFPHNWPNYLDIKATFFEEKKFVADKYYMFLKRMLIPNEAYEKIGATIIRSKKKRKEFVTHKINKTFKLQTVLINMPEFREYILTHPTAIRQIMQEFTADPFLQGIITKTEKNYCDILFKCAEKIKKPKESTTQMVQQFRARDQHLPKRMQTIVEEKPLIIHCPPTDKELVKPMHNTAVETTSQCRIT